MDQRARMRHKRTNSQTHRQLIPDENGIVEQYYKNNLFKKGCRTGDRVTDIVITVYGDRRVLDLLWQSLVGYI